MTNNYIDTYYNIMNILDYLALNDLTENEKQEQYKIALDQISTIEESQEDFISSLADANDCGHCTTLQEVVEALKKNFASGERI